MGALSSKQGLVFTSIKKTLKSSSIMKSSPKTYSELLNDRAYLEVVNPFERVNLAPDAFEAVGSELFDLDKDVPLKINGEVSMLGV